jgi:hypothetical protein
MLLDTKVLKLQRTREMFEKVFGDCCLKVWLCPNKDYIAHCSRVIADMPLKKMFKIGITVDPHTRFYMPHYAYAREYQQKKDGVKYEGMVVLRVHVNREVIATLEHCLIKIFKDKAGFRCVNRKVDEDQKSWNDDSSNSESEDGPGPHTLYVVYGDRRKW